MFQYQSLFRQAAAGKAFKVIMLTVLSAILMGLFTLVLTGIFSIPAFSFYDSPWVLLYALIGVFLFFLLGIFLLYPMGIGIVRYFTQAYKGKEFGLGELFFVFKEGRYSKAVKITVLVVIFYIIFSLVIGLLGNIIYIAVNAPFSAFIDFSPSADSIEASWTAASGQMGMFILMFLVNIIVGLVMYIPYILVSIYIGLIYLSFVDQPLIPTMDKFKIAWDVMFKSGESVVKLFFSNILLVIGVSIVYFIIIILGLLIGITLDSPATLIVLFIVGTILYLVLYVYVIYIIIGSIVAYYYSGRDKLDEQMQSTSQEVPADETEQL